MTMSATVKKSPLKFFVLVYVLALPFWLLGALSGGITKTIPINLPISALMFVCPITAAVILTYREQKSRGVKQLLTRVFDYKRTKQKIWYVPTFLFPNYGSFYDPAITGIFIIITASFVTFFWGAKTLARYRCAHPQVSHGDERGVRTVWEVSMVSFVTNPPRPGPHSATHVHAHPSRPECFDEPVLHHQYLP